MRRTCIIVGCVIGWVALAVFGLLVAFGREGGPRRVDDLEHLQRFTRLELPLGTKLVEGKYRTWPDWYAQAALLMSRPTAEAFLTAPPFEELPTSSERLLTDSSPSAGLRMKRWHPDSARQFIANRADYGLVRPDDEVEGHVVHEGWHIEALVDLDDPDSAAVYVYWSAHLY